MGVVILFSGMHSNQPQCSGGSFNSCEDNESKREACLLTTGGSKQRKHSFSCVSNQFGVAFLFRGPTRYCSHNPQTPVRTTRRLNKINKLVFSKCNCFITCLRHCDGTQLYAHAPFHTAQRGVSSGGGSSVLFRSLGPREGGGQDPCGAALFFSTLRQRLKEDFGNVVALFYGGGDSNLKTKPTTKCNKFNTKTTMLNWECTSLLEGVVETGYW